MISNSNFTDNYAKNHAGAIEYASGASDSSILNSIFKNNKAGKYVGAVRTNNNLTIDNSYFEGNNATSNGAVLFQSNSKGSVVSNCVFKETNDDEGYSIANAGNITLIKNNISGSIINKLGTLSLEKNNIIGIIDSNGNIISTINIDVMKHTNYTSKFEEVLLFANITDDNGNLIIDENFNFTIGNIGNVKAVYNETSKLYEYDYTPTEVGIFVVNMTHLSNNKLDIKTSNITFIKDNTLNVTIADYEYGKTGIAYVSASEDGKYTI